MFILNQIETKMISISTSICLISLCVAVYAVEIENTTVFDEPQTTEPVEDVVATTTGYNQLYEYVKSRLNQAQAVPSAGMLVSLGEDYSTDSQNVYYKRMLIPGASASSFQVFREDYAKDVNNVYFKGFQIPGALSDSFQVLYGGDYARDANNVYYKGLQITGADANTFEVHLKDEYAKDANHLYYKGRQIPGSPTNGLPIVAVHSSEESRELFIGG